MKNNRLNDFHCEFSPKIKSKRINWSAQFRPRVRNIIGWVGITGAFYFLEFPFLGPTLGALGGFTVVEDLSWILIGTSVSFRIAVIGSDFLLYSTKWVGKSYFRSVYIVFDRIFVYEHNAKIFSEHQWQPEGGSKQTLSAT